MTSEIKIGDKLVGEGHPTYIIAEIGSNFDGSLERAKQLVDLAKEAGADAAKFQSFKAERIVCKEAFKERSSFQARWDKSVWDIYKKAEFPRDWHFEIAEYCQKREIHFFSSPYDKEAVDILNEIGVPAFKIGSGEITWLEMLEYIASKNRPIILSTGASNIGEIEEAVKVIRSTGNARLVLLQCVTQYPTPFRAANIRAMVTLKNIFNCPVGYSDHTPGSVVPLGAVALGGCMIEKHFTDDKNRPGPDHPFAMEAANFKKMVDEIRALELALGSPQKDVVDIEKETVILQRRSIFAAKDISKGTKITEDKIIIVRPAKGILPKYKNIVIGRKAKVDIRAYEPITWDKI